MASYDPSPQDEGYSEDPLTVGIISGSANPHTWVASLPVAQRTEYVMSIIDQLPTSEVCEIVRRLRPRLYIDFFKYLPPEVCLKILGFLDPLSLINTARASREWMLLALDRKLWEQLYYLEGFRVVRSEVQMFENALNVDSPRSGINEHRDDEPSRKRRATPQRMFPTLHGDGDFEMLDADTPLTKQESLFGPSNRGRAKDSKDVDEDMVDLPKFSPQSSKSIQYLARPASNQFPLQNQTNHRYSGTSSKSRYSSPISNMASLVVLDRGDNRKKLNWQYLYSQRRRLEANWEAEKYNNFQLPHPSYPEEAHKECIYTIQHSGRYLVSGSRDRTLRIWDLDTRRLVRDPLVAHTGSVLCLQFDADPAEDLIVSGSSDATVVLWKFSTGEVLQRLRKAHRESVLNVRFDKRVLVTCSKDKTIKIFNRNPLHPGELGYPGVAEAVNPVPTYLNNYGFNPSPTADLPVLKPYTMIGCLEGHGAAVNAVQILGDEIVSASGDRTAKVWNWPQQKCTRTLIGHSKGIACVQYDGRRVVCGSSDNEVKVFDVETGLEVASLRAHSNLVRTVQAGFGDLPYSEEEDKEDARNIDMAYFNAVDKGEVERSVQLKGRPRNAGSRKPADITAYGAKLPPGGGGGKYGRIVSGSYDETIIIWRRDKEGVWRAQHTLRQEEAARVASRVRRSTQIAPAHNPEQPASPQTAPPPPLPTPRPASPNPTTSTDVDAPIAPFAPGSASFYHHLIDVALANGPVSLRHTLQAHPQMLTYSYLGEVVETLPAVTRQDMNAVIAAAIQAQQQLPGGNPSIDSGNLAFSVPTPDGPSNQNTQTSTQSQSLPSAGAQSAGQASSSNTTVLQGAVVQTPLQTSATNSHVATQAVAPQPPQAAAPAPHPHHAAAHHHLPSNMARVFKLQFDARRIICCSQTSVIVGWDFANGDEQIIEASRFFAPIE